MSEAIVFNVSSSWFLIENGRTGYISAAVAQPLTCIRDYEQQWIRAKAFQGSTFILTYYCKRTYTGSELEIDKKVFLPYSLLTSRVLWAHLVGLISSTVFQQPQPISIAAWLDQIFCERIAIEVSWAGLNNFSIKSVEPNSSCKTILETNKAKGDARFNK